MAQQKQGKKGGMKKHGRAARHPSHSVYTASNIRFKNKIKRVRRSSGEKAAAEYRRKYGRADHGN